LHFAIIVARVTRVAIPFGVGNLIIEWIVDGIACSAFNPGLPKIISILPNGFATSPAKPTKSVLVSLSPALTFAGKFSKQCSNMTPTDGAKMLRTKLGCESDDPFIMSLSPVLDGDISLVDVIISGMKSALCCLLGWRPGNVVKVVGIELRGMIGVGDGDELDVISLWTGADEFEQESGLQESIEKTMQGAAKKGALPQPPFLFCKVAYL
ncbi:hypothetical protein Tco_0550924, partial [Tanacetum coccineum]